MEKHIKKVLKKLEIASSRGHYLVKYFLLLQWNLNTCLRVKFEGVG